MKKLSKIAGGLLAVSALFLVALTACEQAVADPTGTLVVAPGEPAGEGSASNLLPTNLGQPDPSFTGRRFNINNLPSVATWNALGHQHAYPDPFHFANGNKVITLADWEARRKELSRILQYYEFGTMPAYDKDTIDITWVDSGTANCTITVKHKTTNNEYSFVINTNLSEGLAITANEGKASLPLYFGSTTANLTGGTADFTFSGGFADENEGEGNVPTLYGINNRDPDAPSANMSYAWGMSIILTVMEGVDLNGDNVIGEGERGFRGYYDPKKVGITGYSRNGKAAMIISAFAEGRQGSRVGHVAVGSAGSGGPAVERYLAAAGYQVDGEYADPMPVGQPGLMEYQGLVGKPWYMKKINNGDTMLGTTQVWAATPGGTDDAWRYTTVRGWSPYFETFDTTPTNYSTSVTIPYIGWQNAAEAWSGLETLSAARVQKGWFSPRFLEFADLHYGLDIDHVRGNEGRSKFGILCSIPTEQYFLGALIAPRGLLFQDGYVVPRNNIEGQFAHWVVADEVYKMYGELESGDPEKYIWNNGFELTWGTHGGNTGNEAADRNYHAMRIYSGETTSTFAATNPNLLKLRTPFFPIDDPVSRFEYYRMNWGRPGHPTIADRIKARVDPILPAYNGWRATKPPAPAAGGPTSIQNGYSVPGNTPKYKAMDWRGLIDAPETL
ncbi:MAG: hypothetical protein LBS97_01695 [Treponema sp.]|jgi:hypothetical protein|nr:hypothetical protein [Treponema sp.]